MKNKEEYVWRLLIALALGVKTTLRQHSKAGAYLLTGMPSFGNFSIHIRSCVLILHITKSYAIMQLSTK